MSLKIGIAGFGRRGRSHLLALGAIDTAKVVAIADASDEARRNVELDNDGLQSFTDTAEMVDDAAVDAVIVAAPAHLNSEAAMPAVERGIPVLIEKPPAMSADGVRELRDAASRNGATVMVAFNRRFNPLIRRAIEVINETGPLRQIVAEFHKDIHDFTEDARFSPVIFDHMLLESPIHAVDIITHFADAPLADVVSKVKRTASGYRDVHAALIEFANGVACQFSSAYTAGGRLERYELHGEFVSVYLEGVNSGWVLQNGERSELTISDDAESDTVAQDRYFVDCVSKGSGITPPAANLETSISTLEICEAILAGTD